MTAPAVILLVIAAFMHAGWNLIGKRAHSFASSFLVAAAVGALLLAPTALLYRGVSAAFTPSVWLLVVVTGLFQTLYFSALAGGYRGGDMSLVYPVARSTPAVLVAVFALIVGRADRISAQAFTGIALVGVGGYLLPMRHFTDFSLKKYLSVSLGLALLAALGTAGYSIIDDRALRMMWADPSLEYRTWQVSVVYAFYEAVSSGLWLALYVMVHRGRRAELRRLLRPAPGCRSSTALGGAVLMGAGIYVTYALVLVSMAFVRDVSYVVAFRQLSILLGVAMSAALLKEPLYAPKAVAAVLMFVGLILVGTG